MSCSTIMAIVQENRTETAIHVQDVLTKYGCHIRVRLGLNDSSVDQCSNRGMILLQLCGEGLELEEFEKELKAIGNVKVKHMTVEF
ncbi:MAG: hypothetical protein GX348_01195 [Veillonellaceae bacterium]|mgnify:CR=1 FL=1|jgi:hypothetical protein|nr:hypothetical protein [Veillonellaceae bacterium]